ncbi:hypothetical protein C0995_012413 [Termitomyces sp. Mi166|nr:hypothetical protein C0995_012413 [Termitomyces sp. Mi166\
MSKVKLDDVERDIRKTLFTADTEAFLDMIIPGIPPTDEIFDNLRYHGKHDGTRWAEYPANPPSSGKLLYEPFATISNAIIDAMPEEEIQTKMVYIDRHNRSQENIENDIAEWRPDGAGAQPDLDLQEVEKKLMEQWGRIRTHRDAVETEEVLEKISKERKRVVGLYQLWWMCIHIVYVIKVEKTEEERYSAITLLLVYMRQVLIEQLDRRFVLGFVLLFDELTLVLCDRSGVIMTSTPIDIHSEPKKFVRIIAGLSSMSPAQLGWDTTMKIYLPLSNTIELSYKAVHRLEGVDGAGRYNIHWIIDVVNKGKVEQYVTVSVISAIRSVEVCDRATVVYEVIKYDEKDDPKQTYALKRYWRPIRTDDPELYPTEGEIYEILDDGLDLEFKHAIAYHDIEIDGQVDNWFRSEET